MSRAYLFRLEKIIRVIIIITAGSMLFVPSPVQAQEQKQFSVAAKAFSDGFYDASIPLLERFIREFSDSLYIPRAKFYLGQSFFFKHKYEEAKNIFVEIVSWNSSLEFLDELYFRLAQVYFITEDYHQCLEYTTKVIAYAPVSEYMWEAYLYAAKAYGQLGQLADSERAFRKIIIGSSQEDVRDEACEDLLEMYEATSNYPQIELLTSYYFDVFPQSPLRATMHYYRAQSFFRQAEYAKAVSEYRQALRGTADSGLQDKIYRGMLMVFLEENKDEDAIDALEKIQGLEEKLFSRGVYSLKKTAYVESLEYFRRFLSRFPESKSACLARLYQAESFYRMGRINDALSAYENILKQCPGFINRDIIDDAQCGKGWCYFKRGDYKKAAEVFSLVAKSAQRADIRLLAQIKIADAFQQAGDLRIALQQYRQISDENHGGEYLDYIHFQIGMVLMKMQEWPKVTSEFLGFIGHFPYSEFLPQVYYYISSVYIIENQPQEAQKYLEIFFASYPEHYLIPSARYLFGKSLLQQNDFSGALTVFESLDGALLPDDTRQALRVDMIHIYFTLEQYEEVFIYGQQFLKKFPKSSRIPIVYFYLARAYEKKEMYAKARHFYEIIVNTYQGSDFYPVAAFNLGGLYYRRGDVEGALRCFEGAQKQDGDIACEACFHRGALLQEQRRHEDALAAYEECSVCPGDIGQRSMLNEANLFKELQRYEDAVTYFKKAMTMGADSSDAHLALGFCLEKLKRDEEALEEYSKVIYNFNVSDDTIRAYFRKARLYEQHNNFQEAERMYEAIIETERPEAKIARTKLEQIRTAAPR